MPLSVRSANLVKPAAGPLGLVARHEAAGPGDWGARIRAKVDDGTTTAKDPASGEMAPVGFRLRIAYWQSPPPNGGAYPDPPDKQRCAYRHHEDPEKSSGAIGFRCVKVK